jgi:hypothetical protein
VKQKPQPAEDAEDQIDDTETDEDGDGEGEGEDLEGAIPAEAEGPIKTGQLAKMKAGIGALRWVQWPADPTVKIAIRPLAQEESYLAAAQAQDYAEEVGLQGKVFETVIINDRQVRVMWTDIIMRDEVLSIALRRGDDPARPLFRNTAELRKRLTGTEIARLYDLWAGHMAECCPLTRAEQLGQEELYMQLLDHLRDSPSAPFLNSCPVDTLRALMRFLAEKCSISLRTK